MTSPQLIVGISGASGIIYGEKALQLLRDNNIETHLVISKAGERTRAVESALSSRELRQLATQVYSESDIAAKIASGSFKTLGMLVAPCSMHTLAEIALGLSSNLLTRAADVCLKERRRLVLLTRESPLHLSHLENMVRVTQMGGIIAPPVPAFYLQPQSIMDIVHQTVARALELFDISVQGLARWEGA